MRYLASLTTLLVTALPSVADYTVTQDLGPLPAGATNVAGSTADGGGLDTARFHQGVTDATANWGHEVVYQFELTVRSAVSLRSNSTTGDPDFILLSGLGTSLDAGTGKEAADEAVAAVFLDGTPPETQSFGALEPGVYYLAVEHFDEFDPAVPSGGDSTFDIDINVQILGDYTVNEDLGTLPIGTTSISPLVVTSGQRDAAQYHLGVTGSDGNWGGEHVYQFTLAQPSSVTLTAMSLIGNPDWILLDSLQTDFDAATNKSFATGALAIAELTGPAPVTELLATLAAGTYYLAVESFLGFDGSLTGGDAGFTFDIEIAAASDPAAFGVDLGILGASGVPLNFDTLGSLYDTELAIYEDLGEDGLDATDARLFFNDNSIGTGGPDSELDLPSGLPAGLYTVVVAGSGAALADPFGFTPGGAVGDWVLNYPFGYNVPDGNESGTTSNAFPVEEVQVFSFEIIEAPTDPLIDLGVIGEEGQTLFLDTFGSVDATLAPMDTQLLLYDPAGFIYQPGGNFVAEQPFWDDFDFPDDPTSGLSFVGGLPAGQWYVAVQGWAGDNSIFLSRFAIQPGATSAGGDVDFNVDIGGVVQPPVEFTLPAGTLQWVSFVIEESSGANEITLESVAYNASTGILTLIWDSTSIGPFDIAESTDGENFTPVAGQTGINAFSASFAVDPSAAPTILYQVQLP